MRRRSFSLLFIWSLPAPYALAGTGLQERLSSALASVPHGQAVAGVSVVDLTTNGLLYERQGDHGLIPASNMKVFVMAAALALLGPDFAFETVLATDGANLILVGDGDPGFGDEKLYRERGETITSDFDRWAEALRGMGLTSIPGDLLIDDAIFDDQGINPTWEAEDLGKWYAAPLAGLNFNDNCVDITVSPASGPGGPVRLSVRPETTLVNLINRCRSGGTGDPLLHHPAGTMDYVISGACRKTWPFAPVSFPDPGLLAADALRTALRAQGVMVAGQIRRERVRLSDGRLPPALSVVGTHRTPLAGVLQRIGKDSQNLFAECLLKRLGYEWARRQGVDRPQGSWEVAARAVPAILTERGIDVTGLVVADGSGLSRESRCSARQLTDVLAWMHAQPYGPLFRESLSVAGVDGSLRKRLKDLPESVRAKTGTMRGVRTLAGYVDGSDGSQYAFAILFNGYKGPSAPYKDIQDRICRTLANTPADGRPR